jgi:sugar phosphate isomerase/epimerase
MMTRHDINEPFMDIGVCSWSLQVQSIAELKNRMDRLGIDVVHIACGDPHHGSWAEGDAMPAAAKAAGFRMSSAMLAFPGEDYRTPQSIQRTGGFGPKSLRNERLDRLRWALGRTKELELANHTFHAGFIPNPNDSERKPFLDSLAQVGDVCSQADVTAAFETGQETADLLRLTLDELACPNLKVNFDPANVRLYDMGDPLRAVEILAPHIESVHVKDAIGPKIKGQWGEEVPLGKGEVDIRAFVQLLRKIGYRGPLCIEREVGSQEQRIADIAHGIEFLRQIAG